MVALSSYWASVGIKVDNEDLSKVDAYLAKIENKMQSGTGKKGFTVVPKIDAEAFEKHIRSVLRGFKNSHAFRVKVQVSEGGIRSSLSTILSEKAFKIPATVSLSDSSLASIKEQLTRALSGIAVNARLGSVTSRQSASSATKQPSPTTARDSLSHAQLNTIRRQIARGVVGDSKSAEYWANLAKLQTKTQQELLSLLQSSKKSPANSWNPNPWGGSGNNLARWTEFMAGRPEKSSLSAANRRMSDIMMQGMTGGAPNTLKGMLAETTLGSIGRVGSSSVIGRGLGALGSTFGRAGGAWGLLAGAVVNTTMGAVKGIWSGLGTMVSAPFKLISSASSAVTGAFYRIALAAAPLVMAFNGINKKVQEVSTRDIALNATAGRFGTTGAEEKRWLYNMAMTEGMRYSDMIMPYSSFLSAYAPKGGVEASREMFQAFSQYGRVFGATKESSGRAFYALSQIAGKDQFMSEEVNQQLAEAQGYSGMKGLIAQAYQMSLGKTEKEAKENRNAMKELTDAMRKGLVKPDKIFPILVDLMKQVSAEGTKAARRSPSAEEDRFWNRMEKGWENFNDGGGTSGIANFWNDLTGSVGAWFEENGAWLGKQFEILIQRFKVFRIGLTDLFKYLWTGENTGFVTWLAQEKGIDLSRVRVFFRDFWQGLKGIVLSVASAVGLVDEQTGKVNFEEFGNRLRNFGSSVAKAVNMVMEMFSGFARGFELNMEIVRGGWGEMAKSLVPGNDAYRKRQEAQDLLIGAIGSGFSATVEAGKAVAAPFLPSTSPLYKPKTEELPFVYGDYSLPSPSNTFPGNRLSRDSGFSAVPIRRRIIPQEVTSNPETGGLRMSSRERKLVFPELYPSVAPGVGTSIPTAVFSGGPVPRKIIPQDDFSKLGTGRYTPTAVDELLAPGAAQGGQSFGLNAQRLDNMRGLFPYNKIYTTKPSIEDISIDVLPFIGGRPQAPTSSSILQQGVIQSSAGFRLDAQKMKPLDINVNVKMEVSGDPDQMKLYASEEVAKGIADRVPKLLDESFDYKFSSKMKSVITDAPLN